jgi:hypothetical protein
MNYKLQVLLAKGTIDLTVPFALLISSQAALVVAQL